MDQQCLNPCSNGIWSLTIAKMFYATVPRVLILVLMEYGLWLNTRGVLWLDSYRLNPCSNGIWSLTNVIEDIRRSYKSLNPCSNGIWSLTGCRQPEGTYAFCVLILVLMEYGLWRSVQVCWLHLTVLILVLMEYGLWHCGMLRLVTACGVLILVLMEYGLWHEPLLAMLRSCGSLNPCSNGIWSLTSGVLLSTNLSGSS